MRHLLIQLQPRGLMDVIQSLALIRPGAASIGCKELFVRRRRGLEPTTYLHPCLEPVLRDTHGLMVFEDDAMRVVQALTGVSAPEADRLRKQITKSHSDAETIAISKAFLAACEKNGVSRKAAGELWVQLAKFNSYSFCKSHAVSYGLIAWEAVQWKVRHPLAFWVAALNNNQGMYPRRVYIEAAKRMGIRFLLPCVNRSEREFAACGLAYTGLAMIRTLDEDTREAILADRARRGPFAGLADFRRRIDIGPESLAILIQVGAFDFTGQSRAELMLEAELSRGQESGTRGQRTGVRSQRSDVRSQRSDIRNQNTCLPGFSDSGLLSPDSRLLIPDDWSPTDYSQARRWKEEWDLLGFLVGPPLMSLFRPCLPVNLDDSRCIPERVGRRVRLAGLVATARHTPTKHGDNMQFITLEDEWGLVELTLFPGNCRPVAYLTMGPYIAEGIVEEQHGVRTVTVTHFTRADGPSERLAARHSCPGHR
jgi:DNA polymerase III alpha subunit